MPTIPVGRTFWIPATCAAAIRFTVNRCKGRVNLKTKNKARRDLASVMLVQSSVVPMGIVDVGIYYPPDVCRVPIGKRVNLCFLFLLVTWYSDIFFRFIILSIFSPSDFPQTICNACVLPVSQGPATNCMMFLEHQTLAFHQHYFNMCNSSVSDNWLFTICFRLSY